MNAQITELTDFNDLAKIAGLDEVARQIFAVIDRPQQAVNDENAPTDFKETAQSSVLKQQQIDLDGMLQRYAKIEEIGRATNKIYDLIKEKEYSKTQFGDKIGDKTLVKLWFSANTKTITREKIQEKLDAHIIKNDISGFFERYTLIYGTREVWDSVERERYEAKSLELLNKDAFNTWVKSSAKKIVMPRNIWFDPSNNRRPLKGENHINTFTGLPIAPNTELTNAQAKDECRPILDLLHHLCEKNNNISTFVLRWLALPLQQKGTKMDTALIFHGHVQGAGKSMFFGRIMSRIYGDYSVTLGQGQLDSNYNDWVAGKLYAVFEEIFSGKDCYGHMGFVKQLVTGEKIYISKKFVSGWTEDNYVNSVFLSNDLMPLSLEENDRRHLVAYPKSKIPEPLRKTLETALKDPNNRMISAFYQYLLTLDLHDFTAHTPAIMTDSKKQLIKLSQPSWENFYQEWKNGELQIPYTCCISLELFEFYVFWCKLNNERPTTATRFGTFIGTRETKKLERYIKPTDKKATQQTVICVNIPNDLATSRQEYIGNEISKWQAEQKTYVSDYQKRNIISDKFQLKNRP